MAVRAQTALRERGEDLARLHRSLAAAAAGEGTLAVVQGPAGIGKSSLVDAAGRQAGELGLSVLRARGSELERDFAYGLVRQLFEPPVMAASPRERAELLEGAAERAAPFFGGEAPGGAAPALLDPSFAVLHGLYWLCANLSRRRPLLLAIDDAQWGDEASLRFLHYLALRLKELPIAAVAAVRSPDVRDVSPVLAGLAADAATVTIQPVPLSERAVGEVIAETVGAAPAPAFSKACHAATGGVPFLVQQLVRTVREQGVEPTAAAAERVSRLTPPAVTESIVLRLARLSPEAAELARTSAVLGEADLRLAAALADLEPSLAAAAADELVGAGFLEEGRPLRFVHPIVRAAVESELASGERARRHAAAARRFADEGAAVDRLAAHLLASDGACDEWVVETLRTAAREAVASGAPHSAVAYLRRALAEPPGERVRSDVLLELGFAESYAGDPRAAADLEAALATATRPAERVSTALALGRMLQIDGRNREALDVFDRTLAHLGGDDRRSALTLEGAALGAAQLDAETAAGAAGRLARLRTEAKVGSDVPDSVFGPLAAAAALANEPAEDAARLALLALENAPKLLPEAVDRPPFFYHACVALIFTERFEDARARLDESLADARRLGSLPHVLALSCYRGLLALRTGALADAEEDGRVALETGPRLPGFHAPVALAVLVESLAERGQVDAAEAALEAYPLVERFQAMITGAMLRAARGRLRLPQGRPSEALGDLTAAGELLSALGMGSPAAAPWRSDAALCLHALERHDEARALVTEELTLARAFGAPRAVGVALRAAGLVEGGERGLALLRESVGELSSSSAQLEHARALTDLGAALRRANHRTESRDVLRAALDLAQRIGALALRERAQTELVAAGGRPRRLLLTGVDALTSSERRVAQMAAAGLTNREIAQQLFVTARTVEGHLTHAYRKLGASSRADLGRLLDADRGDGDAMEPG